MRQILRKLYSSVVPAIAWTVIILVLLCMPGGVFPQEEGFSISNFDKFVHAALFGGFVVLWCYYLAEKYPGGIIPHRLAFMLFIISCLFGIAMEFVQKYWIPGRDYDPMDMLADSIGAFLAWLFVIAERARRSKRLRSVPGAVR